MKLDKIDYPVLTYKNWRMFLANKYMTWILFCGSLISVIINIIIGGQSWSRIVVGSCWLFWVGVIKKPLIEDTAIDRISRLSKNIIILLFIIGIFNPVSWPLFVSEIICYGTIFLIGIIYFSDFKNQKNNIIPFYWLVFAATGFSIISAIRISEINWPAITTFASAGLVILVGTIFFLKPIKKLLKIKFHR